MINFLSVQSNSRTNSDEGLDFSKQARRVSLTSCVTILVILIATIVYSCVQMQLIVQNQNKDIDIEDIDGVTSGYAEEYTESDYAFNTNTVYYVERSLASAIICLCLVSITYTMLFIRETSRGRYDAYRVWVLVLVLIIVAGTTSTIFDAMAQEFNGYCSTVLVIWCLFTMVMVNSIRSIYPLYRIYKLNGCTSLNDFEFSSDSCSSGHSHDRGLPPPIYTISGIVDETSNESDTEDNEPPKYEPKLTPPSYEEVTSSTEEIMISLPVDIPIGSPPKYHR